MTVSNAGSTKPLIPPTRYDVSMALKDAIFKELRVCLPGKVVTNNNDGTINVQPSLMQMNAAGVSTPYQILPNVPFITIQGGNVAVSLPPAIGDNCLVLFSDRCLSSWKLNQGNAAPLPNLRKHDISDGIAIVGLNPIPSKFPIPVLGEAGLIASTIPGIATAKVTILGNKITIGNLTGTLGTILATLFTAMSTDAGLIAVAPTTATAAGVAAAAITALLH